MKLGKKNASRKLNRLITKKKKRIEKSKYSQLTKSLSRSALLYVKGMKKMGKRLIMFYWETTMKPSQSSRSRKARHTDKKKG